MSLITETLVNLHSDGDIKAEMIEKLSSEDAGCRQISRWYLTSGIPCVEIQKYYDRVGGWE